MTLVETKDQQGRQRFNYLQLADHFQPEPDQRDWMMYNDRYGYVFGKQCCSNELISFHYVKGKEMLMFNYFLNNLKVNK